MDKKKRAPDAGIAAAAAAVEEPIPPSVDEVVSNIDLMTEILLRLPVKSLIRFKSVSKNWNSLITDPSFAPRSYVCNPNLLSPVPYGFFIPRIPYTSMEAEFIPFNTDNSVKTPPVRIFFDEILEFVITSSGRFPYDFEVLQSSNGLLLCGCAADGYRFYNPTTKKVTSIDKPRKDLRRAVLAFDPKRSPHYRIVCYRFEDRHCWLEVYSSETQTWKTSSKSFHHKQIPEDEVYWNDAINGLDGISSFRCLKLSDESILEIKLPPPPDGVAVKDRRCTQVVESCDHLVFVDSFIPRPEMTVYEMKRDYSGWIVKYNIDLSKMENWEPTMSNKFLIHALVLGHREEDLFLVFQLAGQYIRYNLVSKNFQKLRDLAEPEFNHIDRRKEYSGEPMPGILVMEPPFLTV